MKYKKYNSSIYARFDKGDEVLTSIIDVCKKENICLASFSGIGGCGEVTVGTYEIDKADYKTETKTGMLEMLSINGNVTVNQDNELFAHAHAMFSYIDENNKIALIGGHLKKAVILLTGEVVIKPELDEKINRIKDKNVGINVWDLH